jgi:hypothetical protein
MSSNISDPAALPRQFPELTQLLDQLAVQKSRDANTPTELAVDDMVRKVAASIEQAMKGFFDHQSKLLDRHHEDVKPLGTSDGGIGSEYPAEISSLKGRISEMRTEALHLLHSSNPHDRVRGQDELNVAVELLNLIIFMLEQQMQIQVQRARFAR